MKLVRSENPILHTELEKFDFDNPPEDPVALSRSMIDFMLENNGIGLSANQVGKPYRMFVMRGEPEMFACFNPRIVLSSDNKVILDEGCLSYPGLSCKVRRPIMIKVRFQTPNSETMTKEFYGMTARVFQHELDHLDGITMLERVHPLHKDRTIRQWKKLQRRLK